MRIESRNIGDALLHFIRNTVLIVLVILCVYPFYYVIIYSFSDPYLAKQGVWLWPRGFSLDSYEMLFKDGALVGGTFVSIARTVLGTTITVLCTSLLAFLVTRKELLARKFVYRFCIITMYLNAGIIPWYLVMKAYGFQDNFLLYIIPGAINPYYMILIKTFMEQLPESLEESAAIEGASFFTIFSRIVLPLSKPIIATVSVYSAVAQWNSWQDNFFLVHDSRLKTLQLVLQDCLKSSERFEAMLSQGEISAEMIKNVISPESLQMSAIVATMAPILLVYPFAQRYFTKGIMMGAVKG